MKDEDERSTPPSQDDNERSEAEIHGLMREIIQEQAGDEFWPRLFDRNSPALPQVSRLNRREIQIRVAMTWFADTFGQAWMRELIIDDLALRPSIDGNGRREAVTAYTGVVEQKARGILRIRGLMRGEG